MNRIVIIGVTGAGKTTLAQKMAARTGIPAIDLDDLHWRPGWVEAPREDFRAAVDAVTSKERWIVAGNYSIVRDLTWDKADTLIWLDPSFSLSLFRLVRRTASGFVTGKPLCNGNRESLSMIFSKEGVIPWLFQTYLPKKREYGAVFGDVSAYPQARKIRLRSQRETEDFVQALTV